jgi:hypothetical protein
MNANYTLLDILSNNISVWDNKNEHKDKLDILNGIEIPMIQRDYAFGRSDEKTKFIRNKFLTDIYKVLKSNQAGEPDTLNLDFVYGYIENEKFVPLDGQQRLTTLFIIHWFLAFKDDIDFETLGLQSFSYKTRQATKEFMRALSTSHNLNKIRNECQKDFSSLVFVVKNQPWYNRKWNLDPTVHGFLQTLSDVAEKFIDINFNVLTNHKPLSFHFLRIEDYGLGDNLYIKMNARGKSLSDFENFKASFENVIPKKNDLSKKFIQNIDGVWLDVFWRYSLLKGTTFESNVEEVSKRCDYILLNFIKKVTEYLFYKNDIDDFFEFTEDNIQKIYSEEKNLEIIVQSFDLLATITDLEDWHTYFDEIFSNMWAENRVATHQSSNNFILKVFNGELFQHYDNLLFFSWMNFVLRSNTLQITEDLKDFVRISRNYINNINQKKKTRLDTELRTEYYSSILNTINSIGIKKPYANLNLNEKSFRKEYIEHEITKHKLFNDDYSIKNSVFKFEDHPFLKGLIFNFDFSSFSSNEIDIIVANFYNLFELKGNVDIIRLLLCYGNYSVKIGVSNLGDFKYFGHKEGWHRVLASPDFEVRPNFVELFSELSVSIILSWDDFIETRVVQNIEKYRQSWLWYCMNPKFKQILDHSIYTDSSSNRIETFSNPSLNSYHFNPFVYWLRFHSDTKTRSYIDLPDSCAMHSNYCRLHLINGIQLEQVENTWLIYNLNAKPEGVNLFFLPETNCFKLDCNNLIEDLQPYLELLANSPRNKTND